MAMWDILFTYIHDTPVLFILPHIDMHSILLVVFYVLSCFNLVPHWRLMVLSCFKLCVYLHILKGAICDFQLMRLQEKTRFAMMTDDVKTSTQKVTSHASMCVVLQLLVYCPGRPRKHVKSTLSCCLQNCSPFLPDTWSIHNK